MYNPSVADVFEIVGNTDTFEYAPKRVTSFSRSNNLRGGCYIGDINGDIVPWLENRLREIPIIRYNPEWDCQTWIMEALRMMKYDGLITGDIGERRIRMELALERERWEVADDTLEARLFST
jgi:hypothetical protein